MKKLVVTMLTVLSCGAAYALPIGNPSEASLLRDGLIWEGHCGDPCDPCFNWCDSFSLRAGFYGDYVFNRHMKTTRNAFGGRSRQIEHFEIWTNAGYLALNFFDRVDIFSSLGATSLSLNTNEIAFEPFTLGSGRIEMETDTRFSWSLGARATLWECGCTALGIEGQYFRTNPHLRRVTRHARESVYPDINLRYDEWQVGLGISHRINILVPYIAVKYARARLETNRNRDVVVPVTDTIINAPELRSKKHWGYAVGVSLVDCEKAALTVEGRFADEKALYVNGQIRF